MVWCGSRIFWAVNPWPVISAPFPSDSTGVRTLNPTRTTAGIISPTYAVVLLRVSSAKAIFVGSIEELDFERDDCAVLESAATRKVSSGVRIVLPPASTLWGGIL